MLQLLPSIVQGGLGLMGNIFGANTQADIERQRAEEEKRRYENEQRIQQARMSAYDSAIKAGQGMATGGEAGFNAAVGEQLPELEQAAQDILKQGAQGLQQGAGQLGAELEKGGIRGGQAATQLRRGIGSMAEDTQMDINRLKYEDAAKRAAEKRAYEASKASQGRAGLMQQAAY